MTIEVRGKGAMIWRLREFERGDVQKQKETVLELGLDWVSPKIADGTDERWEGSLANQNADLLPDFVDAMREIGVRVIGWVYTYGRRPERSWGIPSASKAADEALTAIRIARKYGITHIQIDAEGEYRANRMAEVAERYCVTLNQEAPDIEYSLCSFRYVVTHQPDFPIFEFAPHMDGWCPQVYFLGDNRKRGGSIQLNDSFNHYMTRVKRLPYFGIAPTYVWTNPNTGEPWTASYAQLIEFFTMAVMLGNPAVGIWDLPQANDNQLRALADFKWPDGEPPTPPSDIAERLRNLANVIEQDVDEHTRAFSSVLDQSAEFYAKDLREMADQIEDPE